MAYKKRYDGRGFNDTRPIEATAGVIKNADGSAHFKIGKTEAYAAVYGPRSLHPRFMQDPKKGVLRCFYGMMPFSGAGDRVRPGPNRRSKELCLVIQKALMPVLDLSAYPNAVVDLFIDFPQTDAGTRCAAICAASIALADAGFPMRDMVTAVSLGKVEDKMVIDLDYQEEAHEDGDVADIPLAMVPSTGEITLLQADGFFTADDLKGGLADIQPVVEEIAEQMRAAVRARYEG
ncbi:MAG: exosome complex exonuclease Rrp41 [Candidatus Woesearchaeota archaeon]|nr:exosome complex exonuclease Rrp41 [Candidatus Woesearchaeota archaeon]